MKIPFVLFLLFTMACSKIQDTANDNPAGINDVGGQVAIAKRGSIKVSDNNVCCGSPIKEQNILTDTTARLWVNCPSPNGCASQPITIQCNDGYFQSCIGTSQFGCPSGACPTIDTGYAYADITVPDRADGTRCTVTLYTNFPCIRGGANNQVIGSDSWVDGI